MTAPKVLIASPIRDWLYSINAKCFLNIARDFDVEWDDDRILPRARNKLAKRAIDGGYDFIFFIDTDITFEKQDIERIIEMGSAGANIVSGRYFNRGPPYNEQAFVLKGKETGAGQSYVSSPLKEPIVCVDGVGTGFLLIRTSTLKEIPEPWFDWDTKVSEDIYFCNKARAAKQVIYYVPAVTVGHVGPMEFTNKTLRAT